MSRLFAALAIVLLALPAVTAQAKKAPFSTATMCEVLQPCRPPAQYASGPFLEPPQIVPVTLRRVQAICGAGYAAFLGKDAIASGPATVQAVKASGGGFNFSIMGCAQLTGNACIVHLPSDLRAEMPELYALVLAHELGHCRGWVHARY